MSGQDDWIRGAVSQEIITEAKRMRAERDELYGNIFGEVDTDLRWVGEIGEICFDRWLQRHDGIKHQWILEDAAGQPDFVIGQTTVGMKTVKRNVPMLPHYTAQITATHAGEPVDHFFFACYEVKTQRLVLLGGITREDFLRKARYYGPGEHVHAAYIIRPGHEIYNIEVRWLVPPHEWLATIREDG